MAAQVKDNVLSIIENLENLESWEDVAEYFDGYLDINWILNADRSFKGARILVAFGGPNIWIDTVTGKVEGYWWNDTYIDSFRDNGLIEEYFEEIFGC